MNRLIAGALGFVVLAAFESPQASAQPQVPAGPARPVFSPYLNLLNGGNPALNYFGLVVPQMQMQQQLSQLQMQQQAGTGGQSGQQADPSSLFPPTGTVAVFNSTGSYFNRVYVGSGTSGGGGSGGSGGASGISGGSFNRLNGAGGGAASGFQRGGSGAGGIQPSFAAPIKAPAGSGANKPK